MNIAAFLADLKQQDIIVYLESDSLKLNAPKGAVSQDMLTELKAHKADIIVYLQGQQSNPLPIKKADRALTRLPLSFAQQRLWFIDQLFGSSEHYNMATVLEVSGAFDLIIAEKVMQHIVERHEILRSVYREDQGEIWQEIQPDVKVNINVRHLTCEPAGLKAVFYQCVSAPFDLQKDLMIRIDFFTTDTQQQFLIINLHHIAGDGFSFSLLMEEFVTRYREIKQNLPESLPPLPVQYADYAYTQQSWVADGIFDAQLDYWQQKLAGIPAIHQFPLDFQRPEKQTNNGVKTQFRLEKHASAMLRKHAGDASATLFMLLHAAFSVFIARYSQQTDIVIGTPATNRKQKELQSLIGLFVNTLALRTEYQGNIDFMQFLQHVKQVNIEAQMNQDLPFDVLVEKLTVSRNIAYSPLFQFMFTMDMNETSKSRLDDMVFTSVSSGEAFSKFDLELDAIDDGDTILFEVVYNSSLFHESTIARLLKSFEILLIDIAQAPYKTLDALALLDENEKRRLGQQLAIPPSVATTTESVQCQFERQAEQNADATALIWQVAGENQTLTYCELNQRANRLAHHLTSQGVKPGNIVALCLPRSPEMIISILAVLKAGAAYTPIDIDNPQSRIQHIIADCQPVIVVTNNLYADKFVGLNVVVELLSPETERYSETASDNPNINHSLDELAYIMYTSGSTGKPKGVMVEHMQLSHFVAAALAMYSVKPDDNVLQFSSFAFDISVEECFVTLCAGATLVLRNDDWLNSADLFWQQCGQHNITVTSLPTAFWHQVSSGGAVVPDTLRLVIVGGEAINAEIVRHWFASGNRPPVMNTYGPTETTVLASHYLIESALQIERSVPIGRVCGHVKAYIVDEHLDLVPQGVIGELVIGGKGVSRGYLNRPEEQQRSFIQVAFFDGEAERLYRTGDLVRFNVDGEIEYIGRKDSQIKIRGFRIEPGEIENQLIAIDGVKQAIVAARDCNGNKQLIAYYVADVPLEPAALKKQLSQVLPEYMLPNAFISLAVIPMTLNGKVDHKALLNLNIEAQELLPEGYSLPQGELEQQLAEMWQQLLGQPKVSRTDNFFRLGGHSLLAIKLVSEIQQALAIQISVRAVFESQTLAEFAQLIAEQQIKNDYVAIAPIIPVAKTERFPLSFAQQRLWFIDQLDGQTPQYNMPLVLTAKGDFNPAIAEQAINIIVQRHQVLRTVYRHDTDGAWQEVLDKATVKLTRADYQNIEEKSRQQQVQEFIQQHTEQAFDLANDVMLRIAYLKMAEDQGVIIFNMHHIASDGWSIKVLVDEFVNLYNQLQEGKQQPVLPPLPIQYRDYAVWQRQQLQGETLQTDLNYWLTQLNELPPVHDLLLDYSRPLQLGSRGGLVEFRADKPLLTGLKSLAGQCNTSLFVVLHTAFTLLLARHSQSKDIVVGTPVANRLQAEVEPLIGFFVNMLVLRTHYQPDLTLTEYLSYIRQVNIDAQAHQSLPFELLVEKMQPERSASYSPLFQIVFSMDTNESRALQLSHVEFESLEREHVTAQFDLALDASEDENGLDFSFEYNCELFERSTITQFSQRFLTLLSALVNDQYQTAPLAKLPVLTEQERQYLLIDINDNRQPYPVDKCIHSLFEAQVERCPEQIAVIDGERHLTYRQVNAQANQIAHFLLNKGYTPNVFIAVCMERTADSVMAVLGILKAGLAYVPFDTDLPAPRIEYLLQDSGTPLIVVDDIQRLPAAVDPAYEVWRLDEILSQSQIDTNIAVTQNHSTATHLAYMTYTSGTTGHPKGVMVEHTAMIGRLYGWDAVFGLFQKPPTILQMAGLAVDIFLGDIVKSLTTGGRLVICRKSDLITTDVLYQLIEQQHVTFGDFVPVILRNLLDYAEQNKVQLNSLRTILVGSEAWYGRDLSRLQKRIHTDARCFNIYGQTESVIDASYSEVTHITLSDDAYVPIGTPFANTHIYILDAYGEPVPMGVAGEITVGGPGLARGYNNNNELTQQKFVKDTLSGRSGYIYHTGDQARWQSDGTLAFLGRSDDQIKLRGFRIELAEINAKLRALPDVQDAIATVREIEPGNKQIIAYLQTPQPFLVEQFREQLRHQLPHYMIPSAFVCLDVFPVSITGKVDKEKLPAPEAGAFARTEYVAPENDLERTLASIFEVVLQQEKVGRYDNFFALGGDSILIVRVVAMAKQAGLALSVKDILAYQSIHEITQQLPDLNRRNIASKEAYHAFSLLTDDERAALTDLSTLDDVYPLSSLQMGSIYHQLKDESYHIVEHYAINAEWNEQAFYQVFNAIVQRHELLRVAYNFKLGRALQYVRKTVALPIVLNDWRNLSAQEFEHQLGYCLEQENNHFFVEDELMWRVNVLIDAGNTFVLVLSHQHAILDGWSVANLTVEFMGNYLSVSSGGAVPLRADLPHYGEYIAEELAAIDSPEQKTYWQHIANAAVLPDWTGKESTQHYASRLELSYLHDDLQQLAGRLNVPLRTLLLAVHVYVLAKVNGTDSITSSVVSHGRLEVEGAEACLGLFLNTPPVNANIDQQTWASLIQQLTEYNTASWPYRHYPVAMMQEVFKCDYSGALFNYVDFHVADELQATQDAESEQIYEHEHEHEYERVDYGYDLVCHHSSASGFLALQLALTQSVFKAHQVSQILAYYETAIKSMLVSQHHRLAHTDYLAPGQIQHLYQLAHNQSAIAYDCPSLTRLFASTVRRLPDEVALSGAWGNMSYQQLALSVDKLAAFLTARGIGINDTVGIYLSGSPEVVISVLAILQANATFVPLSTDYPTERITHIINDADIQLIVSRRSESGTLPVDEQHIVMVDEIEPVDAAVVQEVTLPAQERIAYIMYTSGSTGTPKGIKVSHHNLLSYYDAIKRCYPTNSAHTVLQIANIGFDIFIEELMLSVFAGGRLVLENNKTTYSAQQLCQIIDAQKVTLISVPTALWHEWTYQLTADDVELIVNHLKVCIVGGEAMRVELLALWQQKTQGKIRLFNTYGPTETTIVATAIEVTRLDTLTNAVVPIGRPLAHCQTYVLDSLGGLVPFGVIGELYIAGDALSLGYINKPEQNAAQFVELAVLPEKKIRLYKTGDRVYWNDEGELIYVGRSDNQVKIRGFRIETREIESALSSIDGVVTSIVRVTVDSTGEKQLCAWLVMPENTATDTVILSVKEQLKTRLPEYMVPALYAVMAAIPTTTNGKVDFTALPEPKPCLVRGSDRIAETEVEKQLMQLCAEALKLPLDMVSLTASFMEMGGNSLTLLRFLHQIQQTFTVVINVADIMTANNLAMLALTIECKQRQQTEQANQGDNTVAEEEIKLVSLGHAQTPLFLVPGAGASASSFTDLAREIEPDYCIQVFDAGSLFLQAETPSVKTLAERYAALLVQDYPQEHYRLVGDCVGACVAFEVALALENKGKTVDVTAIDSFLTAYEPEPYTREEIDEVKEQLAGNIEGHALENFIRAYKCYSMMVCNYIPSARLKGKMTFIYCESSIQLRAEKEKIITSLQDYVTQTITCGMVSGDHYSVLKPGAVETLAEAILLQRYQPEPSFQKSNLTYQELLDVVQYRADIYRPATDINHYSRVKISQVGSWIIEIMGGSVQVDFNANDVICAQYDFQSEIEINIDSLINCVTSEKSAAAIAKEILDNKIQIQRGEEIHHLLWIVFGITEMDEIFFWIEKQSRHNNE
ncbi:putative Phenylalanine racemase (ATP-hydrolyzing) [Xenorhabdus nematophila str. Anatoliense]|nr:putative Phenylalanine racemase (ATP-hydrolyzing) [Xenorhabdus nematophila str. Anatoliense]